MTADAKELEAVKIIATKPFFEMGVDRKIFNVDKNIVTTGQTATELMKNIPGVNVDIDGNVTLRNANPTIFVDGRPTTLTLDQIPSDAIQSVELITNPSAKFDASGGTAGIINIILKKNRKAGYNGNLRAGVDSRGKFNGGGDFNIKQGKINFFASLNVNQRKSIGEGFSYSKTHDTPRTNVSQNTDTNNGFFMAELASIT
jgi:outer membrane receptor protein involved in Fe transport